MHSRGAPIHECQLRLGPTLLSARGRDRRSDALWPTVVTADCGRSEPPDRVSGRHRHPPFPNFCTHEFDARRQRADFLRCKMSLTETIKYRCGDKRPQFCLMLAVRITFPFLAMSLPKFFRDIAPSRIVTALAVFSRTRGVLKWWMGQGPRKRGPYRKKEQTAWPRIRP